MRTKVSFVQFGVEFNCYYKHDQLDFTLSSAVHFVRKLSR